jgi:hypothetical protein
MNDNSVSFVNAETKEQPKRWMHTHSPNKPKTAKQSCLPARKLIVSVLWDRKGVLIVGIHETRDHNNFRSALQNT